jgi:HD-GYP domain-containing protein (c-di-GMP phosphodiesterase class II)
MFAHACRVADLSRRLAQAYGLDHRVTEVLERAALVHDLPKLVVPDAILAKGGPLLPQELDLVRVGPVIGHELLLGIEFLEGAARVVRARYEWWDGSGYPRGLESEAIPIESRVLAVADTFDTLTQPRRYRAAMDDPAALAEILRCRGTQFDPDVVDALQRVLDETAVTAGTEAHRLVR